MGPHQKEGRASIYPVFFISFLPLEAKSAQASLKQYFTAQKNSWVWLAALLSWCNRNLAAASWAGCCVSEGCLHHRRVNSELHQDSTHKTRGWPTLRTSTLLCSYSSHLWPAYFHTCFSHSPSNQFQFHLSCHSLVLSTTLSPLFNQ